MSGEAFDPHAPDSATDALMVLALPKIIIPGEYPDFTPGNLLLRTAAQERRGYGVCLNRITGTDQPPVLATVGTEMVVEDFTPLANDQVQLRLRAARRFRIVRATCWGEGSNLFRAEVIWRPSEPFQDPDAIASMGA